MRSSRSSRSSTVRAGVWRLARNEQVELFDPVYQIAGKPAQSPLRDAPGRHPSQTTIESAEHLLQPGQLVLGVFVNHRPVPSVSALRSSGATDPSQPVDGLTVSRNGSHRPVVLRDSAISGEVSTRYGSQCPPPDAPSGRGFRSWL